MRSPAWTLLLLVCSPVLLLLPAQRASAAGHSVLQSKPIVRTSGGAMTILVRARARPRATCTATVSARRSRVRLAAVRADARGRVGWRWLIRSTSPSGTWTIAVRCSLRGQARVAVRRTVVRTGSKRARGSIGDPTSLTITAGRLAATSLRACGPFRAGAACLVWRRRTDVYDAAVAAGVPPGGARPPGAPFQVWDGGQWLVNAQAGGIATGAQPVPGALVVWGVPGSASTGHVGYVRKATSDTRVLISECGFDWSGRCRTAWRNPTRIAHLQGYVYRAPVAPPPPPPPSGRVALWHMGETSGTMMLDSAGGIHGTLHNVALGVPGSSGSGYGFNGSSSWVEVPPPATALNPGSDNVTIRVDVNIATTAPNPPPAPKDWDLVRKGVYTTQGGQFKVEIQAGWLASCGFKGSTGYAEVIATGPALNDGLWHTITCTKTATAIVLAVGQTTYSTSASLGDISNVEPVVIGSHVGVSEFFNGRMDELSITIGGPG